MKRIHSLLAVALAAAATLASGPAAAQDKQQFFPMLTFRTGPYAPSGTPWANGFLDYYKLVNLKGGINGVRAFTPMMLEAARSDPAYQGHIVNNGGMAGLLTPHASVEMGGLGLSHVEKAVVFEEAGYSRLGPTALNIHAPDEGNIHLLEAVVSEAHKERWLRPQVLGETRSCCAMTEPDPGAGADPSMLKTTAVQDADHYIINGEKWFITGAEGADYAIIMARMEDGSATMFLSDMDRPGITLERSMDAMDACFTGGHGVLRFDDLRVPATDVLGEVGQGFRYAQVRLAPARLTHCMRWLGQARRAHGPARAIPP